MKLLIFVSQNWHPRLVGTFAFISRSFSAGRHMRTGPTVQVSFLAACVAWRVLKRLVEFGLTPLAPKEEPQSSRNEDAVEYHDRNDVPVQ